MQFSFFYVFDFFRVFGLSKMPHEPTAGAYLCKWHLAKAWKLTWEAWAVHRCVHDVGSSENRVPHGTTKFHD